jgi:DNA-binding transcriptional regulator/RsmH inhibitor MraZ
MPVSGEAKRAKNDVEEVIRDLSRVVSGRLDNDEFIEIKVEDITPVLQSRSQHRTWDNTGRMIVSSHLRRTHSQTTAH